MERAHLPMQQQDHSTVHGPIGPAFCFVVRQQNLGLGPLRIWFHSEKHLKWPWNDYELDESLMTWGKTVSRYFEHIPMLHMDLCWILMTLDKAGRWTVLTRVETAPATFWATRPQLSIAARSGPAVRPLPAEHSPQLCGCPTAYWCCNGCNYCTYSWI